MTFNKGIQLVIFVLCSQNIHGQIIKTSFVISNKADNDTWLTNLERQETTEQIRIITNRLISDTLTYVTASGDRIKIKPLIDSVRIDVYCRTQIIFNGIPLYIKNNTPTNKIKDLAYLLRQRGIEKIEIIKDEKATALYGTQGLCGLLLITSKDKRITKKIRKLDL